MEDKKIALVLSGGGAKGSFQVGAISHLIEKGVNFDVIAGVSVGSLNGAMVAQDKISDLIKVWQNITNDKVYKKYTYLSMLYRNLFKGMKSLYSAAPLFEQIQENIKKEDFKKKFYLGITSLMDGLYYSCTTDDFETSYDLQMGIYASSLMPIIWEPVDVKVSGKTLYQSVDGGLRNVTPLGDILNEVPDHIYIISCNTKDVDIKHPRNIINVATRTFMDIMLSEVIDTDIKDLIKINNLVLQAQDKGYVLINPTTKKEYKYFDCTLIEPPYPLASSIDFSQDKMQSNFKLGYSLIK